MRVKHDFGPVFDKRSLVLILGSFPSVKSREQQFYYGHPQNRFWPLLYLLLGEDLPAAEGGAEISAKRELLLRRRIALWDVIESCEITGSSDSSIRNVRVNDLSLILHASQVKHIFTNGRKADAMYRKYMEPSVGIRSVCLPSTSPANAAWSMERLREAWQPVADALAREEAAIQEGKITFEAVYALVRKIPRGKVASYGQIAARLGNIRWSRVVGYALHGNPDGDKTPCYRVVNRDGRVSDAFVFGGRNRQIEMLRADGIEVSDEGYVNMSRYQHHF